MSDTTASRKIDFHLPFGLRVREIRSAANMTQEQLADMIGTTKATISKMERSTGWPKRDWIEKLAAALDVSVDTLLFGGELRSGNVPVIGLISAGNWREAIQTPDEHIWIVEPKPHTFALKVHGDSIDKVAPDGSYVTIDPTNPNLTDGGIYAVQNGSGEATLKRFRRNPDRLEPESTNPTHKPIMLGSEPITVIGRVEWIMQKA